MTKNIKNILGQLESKFTIKSLHGLNKLIHSFSFAEKAVFYIFTTLLILSTLGMLQNINNLLKVEIPAYGGKISEGIIGAPRFINPLLAISDADRDLTALVYSGLLKATPEGDLVADLAKSFEVSEDGLVYTFVLRDDIFFHDGERVTADDVVFTIHKAQDPSLKSPKRANWEGVLIEKAGDNTVRFSINQAYARFLENTTMGILPRHIWERVDTEQFSFSQFNIEPIGSGPYVVKKLKRDSSGIPEYYKLKSFSKYSLGGPYIQDMTIRFYANEDKLVDAYRKNEISNINSISTDVSKSLYESGHRIEKFPLPRVFGVYFNQNEASLFTNNEVREALDISLDRGRIVEEVLNGYGIPISGPIPDTKIEDEYIVPDSDTKESETLNDVVENTSPVALPENKQRARELLEESGWKYDAELGTYIKSTKAGSFMLRFSISTSNAPELKKVANILKEEWESIGAIVDLKFFETGNLNQDIIRPREYDALLFGQITGRSPDPFAFWHSSQRNDPGLNISLYTNITVDKILEDIRTTSDKKELAELLEEFKKEISNDTPAVFIYSPEFIYAMSEDIQGSILGTVATPAERFLDVHKWFIKTDNVWTFFQK